MEFQFKITTWESVTVDPEHEEMILEKIKSGEIETAQDIFELFPDAYLERICEADEQMTVEENKGLRTIEVIEDMESIYHNGK